MELRFNPRNSLSAFLFFIFGSFLIWWSHDKITAFTSVFANNFPKIIVWLTFIFLYAIWVLFVPYLCLTGRDVSAKSFMNTFKYGLIGLAMIIVALPIIQTMMNSMSFLTENFIITGLVWIITFTAIGYYAYYKPIEVLYTDE